LPLLSFAGVFCFLPESVGNSLVVLDDSPEIAFQGFSAGLEMIIGFGDFGCCFTAGDFLEVFEFPPLFPECSFFFCRCLYLVLVN